MTKWLVLLFLVASCAHIPPTPTFSQCEDPAVVDLAKELEPSVIYCMGTPTYGWCLQDLADKYGWILVGCAVQDAMADQAMAPRAPGRVRSPYGRNSDPVHQGP